MESGVRTIAFPAISCGAYGYPIEAARYAAYVAAISVEGPGSSAIPSRAEIDAGLATDSREQKAKLAERADPEQQKRGEGR